MVIIMTTGHNYDLIGNPVYYMFGSFFEDASPFGEELMFDKIVRHS